MDNKFDWIEDCFQTYNDGNWITKRTFKKTAVINDDHHHCLFDAKKLSPYDYSGSEKQGYCSTDGRIWFCKDCFEECAKQHKLRLMPNTIEMVENALFKQKAVVFSLDNITYKITSRNEKIVVLHNNKESVYDDIYLMQRNQKFYGKHLREIIGDLYIAII